MKINKKRPGLAHLKKTLRVLGIQILTFSMEGADKSIGPLLAHNGQ